MRKKEEVDASVTHLVCFQFRSEVSEIRSSISRSKFHLDLATFFRMAQHFLQVTKPVFPITCRAEEKMIHQACDLLPGPDFCAPPVLKLHLTRYYMEPISDYGRLSWKRAMEMLKTLCDKQY